jgi:DNA-binding CsgD family transcriptional regulator/tetratricopeptide (TPR) repeat protein
VRRAVGLDVNRGQLHNSLRRLLAVSDHEGAVRLLSSHGVPLVLSGEARLLPSFARQHEDLIENTPGCWFALALERWQSGADEAARYWLHRVVTASREGRPQDPAAAPVDVTCAHLMLALLADEPLAEAADGGRELVKALTQRGNARWPDLALLQLLLGMAQLRLGELGAAERSLSAVALHGGPLAVQVLRSDALSQLAISEFLRGREHAVLQLASSDAPTAPPARTVGSGLRLAAELSRIQTVVDPRSAGDGDVAAITLHSGDPVTRILTALLESRRFLLRGLAADAVRVLDASVDAADLPDSLNTPLLVEQALHAALSLDRAALKALEAQLAEGGAPGEAAFVAGLRADITDDLPAAIADFSYATEHAQCPQPAVADVASACRAQLLDATGRVEEALEELERAVIRTAVRRNAVPFLGWSRHGTPVARLLDALVLRHPTPWAQELARTTAERPAGITGLAGPVTATPQERARVATGGLRLELSPRERDVLHELARGSTYSGIAANLFVSENTVKTHVSSLYAKLGVARRSEALAVARTLRML